MQERMPHVRARLCHTASDSVGITTLTPVYAQTLETVSGNTLLKMFFVTLAQHLIVLRKTTHTNIYITKRDPRDHLDKSEATEVTAPKLVLPRV